MHDGVARVNSSNNDFVLVGHYSALVILLLCGLVYRLFQSAQFLDNEIVYLLCLVLFGLAVWSLWSWYTLTNSLFDFYVVFFLAAVLFNGGQALLEILHLNSDGILGGRFSSETIIHALSAVVLGLAFFHFGALIAARLYAAKTFPTHSLSRSDRSAYYLRLVGWSLLLISVVPSLLVLQQALRVSISQGYFALYQRQSFTGLAGASELLAKFLIPGALFLLAGSKGRPWSIAASTLVIFSYSVVNSLLGSRIEAAAPFLAYVWLWHRRIRTVPMPVLVLGGVSMLTVVFPFIKVTRNLSSGAKLDPALLLESFTSLDNPILAIISEMGYTLRTVAHTVQLVPYERYFDLGLSYLYATTTVLPNLFWQVHPAVEHSPGNWLVHRVAPSLASIGGGYGYSFIAEAYLNFGWLGITMVLAVIGYLLALFVIWGNKTTDPAKLALLASFGANFMIFARGESGSIIRDLVWYALIPYAIVRVIEFLRKDTDEVA